MWKGLLNIIEIFDVFVDELKVGIYFFEFIYRGWRSYWKF